MVWRPDHHAIHEQHYSNKLTFEPSGSVTTDNLEKAFTSERVQLFAFILRGLHPLECKDLTIDLDQGGLRGNWASFWIAPRMNRGLSPAFFWRLGGWGGGGLEGSKTIKREGLRFLIHKEFT